MEDSKDNKETTMAGTKRPPEDEKPAAAKKPATSTTTQQLQQAIQKQLQEQLQAQLEAAAARGQQANITPAQIQAQATAMVQAAAQAQAVVAAAKSRGDGLVPMNAAQITALSQIQAQAIVNARKPTGTPQQIQTAIQLQCQALIHAHREAQIQAGIYKGDMKEGESTSRPAATPAVAVPAATAAVPTPLPTLTAAQLQQEEELKKKQETEKAAAGPAASESLDTKHQKQLLDLQEGFRQQNASYVPVAMDTSGGDLLTAPPQPSSNSPQFLAQLNGSLNQFWQQALEDIQKLQNQTEHDFKNHNDLPLARIKRIMKSDEDVRMISAEAPVLFAKACELFILDLSIRSWNYSQLHKRRTLQKEDVREAIQKTDIFDFLVDVIH